jgi:hypothetical protein
MKARLWRELRELVRAPMLTPRGFVARALVLAAVFTLCELAGWREHTTFISGTAAGGGNVEASAARGLIYLLAWFGFVLGTPVLLIAALLLAGFNLLAKRSSP